MGVISIDVGSMFLMDISIENESQSEDTDDSSVRDDSVHDDPLFPFTSKSNSSQQNTPLMTSLLATDTETTYKLRQQHKKQYQSSYLSQQLEPSEKFGSFEGEGNKKTHSIAAVANHRKFNHGAKYLDDSLQRIADALIDYDTDDYDGGSDGRMYDDSPSYSDDSPSYHPNIHHPLNHNHDHHQNEIDDDEDEEEEFFPVERHQQYQLSNQKQDYRNQFKVEFSRPRHETSGWPDWDTAASQANGRDSSDRFWIGR